MSNKAQGPAPVDRLEDFLNSDDRFHGIEFFDPPHGVPWVMQAIGIDGRIDDERELWQLRAAMRSLAEGDDPDHAALARLAAEHPVRVELASSPEGAHSELAGDTAVAQLLALLHRTMTSGTFHRVRVCRRPTCGWVYYDGSKNHSGRWCSSECSDLMRTHAYRARRKAV